MLRSGLVLLCLLSPLLSASAADAPQAQWILVTAPAFRDALQPLCDHRKEQGMRVVVVQTTDVLTAKEVRNLDAVKLREHVGKLCRDHQGPSYVILVGAVESGTLTEPEKKVLPPLVGSVGRMKGQPSDNAYGCLDKGLVPAVPVGRFPARTDDEAKAMVRKTLDLERDRQPGPWRRRLTVLAGIPAYNPLVDRLVESIALARFDRLDASWHGRAIYHNAASRFCVPDDRLQAQALKYVQDGQAFTLYLGHSGPDAFYASNAHYLDRDDWARLKINRGSGVFATFGCNGCQLSGEGGEGYGLAAMRNPQGPAAVVGSHGICFAAMVQLAADGLFENAFTGKPPERLGATWLALKEGVAKGKIDDFTYKMLDAVDGDNRITQATQRQEHLEMFLLLGDPALRLPVLAQDVKLKTAGPPRPGARYVVTGTVPVRLEGATVRLTLERPLSSMPEDLEPLPKDLKPGARRDGIIMDNHERANRFAVAAGMTTVADGRFEVTLTLPAKLPWPKLILRVYAATDKEEGLGVLTVEK
jgi:Peptidase family C25